MASLTPTHTTPSALQHRYCAFAGIAVAMVILALVAFIWMMLWYDKPARYRD
jgi:hypothetical protein